MVQVPIIALINGKKKTIMVDEAVLEGLIPNLEGGEDDTVYLSSQLVEGGDANGN